MIFTDRTIMVQKGTSSINDTIVLYRGDKDVEIRFTLNEGSPFRFSSGASPNIIEKTEATYGQLVIKTPGALPPIFSEVVPTIGGKIIFTITAEMIDEITEVGNYTFQIRLLDENKESRVTIPEVVNGIEIREPIASEDRANIVGLATVGYALTTAGATEDTFDSEGNYNKTTWETGDKITDTKLSKIENGIYDAHNKINVINNKVEENTTNTNTAKQDINDIKLQIGTEELTTTSKKLKGAINELGSQIKDIENKGYTRYDMPIQGKVFGHRGLNDFAPENTLVGIQTAYRHGYKSIEVDIHKTSDGNWILMHDGNVDRMTNGTGWVKDMTLSEIKALNIDAGNYLNRFNQVPIKVPTLEEALREIKKLDMTIMLEVKSDITSDEATNLINIVKEEGCLDRVIFCSYLALDRLNKLRGADKNVWLDYTPTTFNSEAIEFMKNIYPCTVDLDGTASNTSIASQVALAQQNDIIALAWTVDNIDRIKYLISLGVKSVITNRTFLGGVE